MGAHLIFLVHQQEKLPSLSLVTDELGAERKEENPLIRDLFFVVLFFIIYARRDQLSK